MKQMTTLRKILWIGLLSLPLICYPQEAITEENFLREDTAIWTGYERNMEVLSQNYAKHIEKRDSLNLVSKQVYETALTKNIENALKYASVPSGLRRVYMIRLDVPKDTLRSIWQKLPKEMQNSPYGKSILSHIETEQIVKGSQYYNFEAKNRNNEIFRLSSLEGKNILLLYGGLDCMGKGGREELATLYEKTDRKNFEIVVYWSCSSLEELKEIDDTYPGYISVSDFLQDHSLFKIIFGAQATPTCFLINKKGTIIVKSVGLPMNKLNKLLENGSLN
jgi:peroxiredoxin